MSVSRLVTRVRRAVRNDQLVLTALALVVGAGGGGGVIVFREAIDLAQRVFYGSATERLFRHADALPWWWLLLAPAVGGLLVGQLVRHLMPGGRPHGVADAIQASAVEGGRMSMTTGFKAALVSALSIGAGASVGREGPAVHLGAAIGGWVAKRLHLTRAMSRTLLGCGAAAAVAASFNAPIAGALFASEVVVGHYALSAFAPIVIASVVGTALSRVHFGDFPAFIISSEAVASFWEVLLFAGLGLLAGLVARGFMGATMLAGRAARALPLPVWLHPVVGGLAVGAIAIPFPQVLGVGYGTTEAAVLAAFPLWLLVAIGAAKVAATALSLGFGFCGGVFSPSLVIGAMLGGAYGIVVTDLVPGLASAPNAFAVVGMGAVAAAVLGAPISTTLIVFEMTGDYALTLVVMVAVVVASAVTRHFHGGSFFAWQLEGRGVDLRRGFESTLLRAATVGQVMTSLADRVPPELELEELRNHLQRSASGELFVIREGGELVGTVTFADLREAAFDRDLDDLVRASDAARRHPPVLVPEDNLETALTLMRDTGESQIAVVRDTATMGFLGCVHERHVLAAYNRALLASRREEHG